MFFISLQKLFPFLRYSSIRILEPEISRHHQMPKHETNIFNAKFGESAQSDNDIWLANLTMTWKLVPSASVFKKN